MKSEPMKITILVMLLANFFYVMANTQTQKTTSVTHTDGIDRFCQNILESEESFAQFRRSSFCLQMIDTLTSSLGWEFILFTSQHYPCLLPKLDGFRKNDSLGDPLLAQFGEYGIFCPTTLRYIKIAGDLESYFGNLDQKRIIEIGGGYGGQCAILSTLFSFKEYIIVDLPEVLTLAKKYLDLLGITNVRFCSPSEVPAKMPCDLLISNYAFSECSYPTQMDYIEKILIHSQSGYMICNDFGYLSGISSLNQQTSRNAFEKKNIVIQNLPEIPLTGGSNYLLIWK